ncbi:serine/threonine-protein kinase ULK3-like [Glandiceps talaboti]
MAAPVSLPNLHGFVFTEKLGSGTYATVYKAFRKSNQREVVAVKCVLKSSLNKTSTENLLTEIGILKKIRHDYIVRLKDFQWDKDYIYLIMEYCSGGDLSNFIRCKRALPEKVVKRFLQQIASALLFLHQKNISHMDLKPQNLLLSSDSDPVLKLADFGFATHFKEDLIYHSLRGSPLYMAPEIICQQIYDASVDLWSVGVILYECLFGQAPFASRTFAELEDKIRDSKPITLPRGIEVSESCRNLLLRLLQRDPRQRISFEDFFNHSFIDLEHMPSEKSLDKGKTLVAQAIMKDQQNEWKTAITLYCKALEYLVPSVAYVKDRHSKEALRTKICEYMNRAEELKSSFKPKRRENRKRHPPNDGWVQSDGKKYQTDKDKINNSEDDTIKRQNSTDSNETVEMNGAVSMGAVNETAVASTSSVRFTSGHGQGHGHDHSRGPSRQISRVSSALSFSEPSLIPDLKELYRGSGMILDGIQKIEIAEKREEEEQFEGALQMYEDALEVLLPALSAEPKSTRRNMLYIEIQRYMAQAEAISKYVQMSKIPVKQISMEESVREDTGRCLIQ